MATSKYNSTFLFFAVLVVWCRHFLARNVFCVKIRSWV